MLKESPIFSSFDKVAQMVVCLVVTQASGGTSDYNCIN